MWYIVLMDAYGDDHDTIPVPHWETLTEDEQVDLLNEYSEVIGMLNAGAYQAQTPEDAIVLAEENADEWIGGCVA